MALILKAELKDSSLDCKLEMPEIIKSFWADKNNSQIQLPEYNDNNVNVIIASNKAASGKEIILDIMAKSNSIGEDCIVYSSKYKLSNSEWHSIPISISGAMFEKGKDTMQVDEYGNLKLIQKWFIKITLNGITKTYCDSIEKYLKIHYIRFIPQIIESKGWNHALLFQRMWFNSVGNDRASENKPYTKLSIDWILSFSRMNTKFENFQKKFVTEKAIVELKVQLLKMINDKLVALPKLQQSCRFGISDSTIIRCDNTNLTINGIKNRGSELMPLFEKYYYQSDSYKIEVYEPLDDCFGALASCQFRAIAFGEIQNIKNKYKVHITKVGVYIKDRFDFDTLDENLGMWSIIRKDVSRYDIRSNYYHISNKSYRDWRDDYGKGGDFFVYSTVKYIDYNYSFWL